MLTSVVYNSLSYFSRLFKIIVYCLLLSFQKKPLPLLTIIIKLSQCVYTMNEDNYILLFEMQANQEHRLDTTMKLVLVTIVMILTYANRATGLGKRGSLRKSTLLYGGYLLSFILTSRTFGKLVVLCLTSLECCVQDGLGRERFAGATFYL